MVILRKTTFFSILFKEYQGRSSATTALKSLCADYTNVAPRAQAVCGPWNSCSCDQHFSKGFRILGEFHLVFWNETIVIRTTMKVWIEVGQAWRYCHAFITFLSAADRNGNPRQNTSSFVLCTFLGIFIFMLESKSFGFPLVQSTRACLLSSEIARVKVLRPMC